MGLKETVYHLPEVPRFALLTDLHGRPSSHILSSLQLRKASRVCIAGDIIYAWRICVIGLFLSQCPHRFHQLIPCREFQNAPKITDHVLRFSKGAGRDFPVVPERNLGYSAMFQKGSDPIPTREFGLV